MKTILCWLSCLLVLFGGCRAGSSGDGSGEALPPPPELDLEHYQVGILVMDGVYNTELTAPYDIFQHTIFREGIRPMDVFTVAASRDWVQTFEGMHFLPDFAFDEVGRIDILVVPSAEHHLDSDLEDEMMIDFVRRVGAEAEFVTSHCDGSFILAQAGLLEGKVCTTFPADRPALRERFPGLDVRDEVLFVHDGNTITSAGGAKSFEAALYLCEFLYGAKVADQLAEGLVIDWNLAEVPHLVVKKAE